MDPFVLFAVVPMVIMAILSFWGNVGILGVLLIVFAIGIVVFDSWANRPYKKSASRPASRPEPRDRYGRRPT